MENEQTVTAPAEEAVAPEAQPSQPPETARQETEAPKGEPTSRAAIERAFAKLSEADKTEPKPTPEPEAQAESESVEETQKGPERGPDGKFKAKDDAKQADTAEDRPADAQKDDEAAKDTEKSDDQFSEPPKRFSTDAKEAWKEAPLPVRAEIDRAVRELEGGIEQYRQAFEPYREFDKELKQNGQDFREVVANYRGIENLLARDPMRGLDTICNNLGTSLREVAEKVLNQQPDQAAAQQEGVIRDLRQEIAGLKEQLGGVTTTIRSDKEAEITRQITDFATNKPRFDELATDIAFFIESGRANNLQEAYDLAERLNPAPPAPQPAPAATAAPQKAPAQTQKADLSLSGAPSSGSNPANRQPSASTREALGKAFQSVGL